MADRWFVLFGLYAGKKETDDVRQGRQGSAERACEAARRRERSSEERETERTEEEASRRKEREAEKREEAKKKKKQSRRESCTAVPIYSSPGGLVGL